MRWEAKRAPPSLPEGEVIRNGRKYKNKIKTPLPSPRNKFGASSLLRRVDWCAFLLFCFRFI
jgi:hypothetical protein